MNDLPLFTPRYPERPGNKGRDTGVAAGAAVAKRAARLRADVLDILGRFDLTADECAARLHESVLSIRPRVSELARKGLIKDTKVRRQNASGRTAIVWRLKRAGE